MCTAGFNAASGGPISKMLISARKNQAAGNSPVAQQAADATVAGLTGGPAPIGGVARPITANTPGQVGTGLQIGSR